ncbi:MAG: hypothetical protein AB7L17_15505 [Ilumatobacteraceae bacterium]
MRNFGYLTVASSLHDATAVDRLTAGVRAALDVAGGVQLGTADEMPDSPLAVLVATGGTESAIIEHVRRRRAAVHFEPTLLLAHPVHNSLPAALESLARIRADGGRGRIVQVGSDDARIALREAVTDVAAIHRLRRTRVGLVGQPSPWLVASIPDADALRSRWGIELVPVDIDETVRAYPLADPLRVRAAAARVNGSAPPSTTLLDASRLHPVLVDAAAAARVDAVTVRCFDYLGSLETSGCVALAEMNDAGFVAGCEGDVASTVAMLMVRALTGRPSWMANPSSIDVDRDQVVLAHCTVAPSMVESVELDTHFESGIGVGLRGRFASGPVTLLRLGGRALEHRWMAEGDIVACGDAGDLCRTQVTVQLHDEPAHRLLDEPLGNHLVLVSGHHRARFERWWQLAFAAA